MVTDEEVIAYYERWLAGLSPEQRRRYRYVTMGGVSLSPEQLVEEMKKGTPLGRRLLAQRKKMMEAKKK